MTSPLSAVAEAKANADLLFQQKRYADAVLAYNQAFRVLENTQSTSDISDVIKRLQLSECYSLPADTLRDALIEVVSSVDLHVDQLLDESELSHRVGVTKPGWCSYAIQYKIVLNRSKTYFSAESPGYALIDLLSISPLVRMKDIEYAIRVLKRLKAYSLLTNLYFLIGQNEMLSTVHRGQALHSLHETKQQHTVQLQEIASDPKYLPQQGAQKTQVDPVEWSKKMSRLIWMPMASPLSRQAVIHAYSTQQQLQARKQKMVSNLNKELDASVCITDSPLHGLGMIAKKTIRPGTTIAQVGQTYYYSVRDNVCHHCNGYSHSYIPCPTCGQENFCSNKCMQEAMNQGHAIVCGSDLSGLRASLRKGKTGSSRVHGMVLKLLAQTKQLNLTSPFQLDIMCVLTADKCQDGKSGVQSVQESYLKSMRLLHRGNERRRCWSLISPEEYMLLFYTISNNVFAAYSPNQCGDDTKDFGQAAATVLYESFSFINHSCIPHAEVTQDSLYTKQPVKAGEEVTISYIPFSFKLSEREVSLTQYGFQCKCIACQVHRHIRQDHGVEFNSKEEMDRFRGAHTNYSRQ